MKVDVVNIQGDKTGRTIELPEGVFGIEPNEHAMYLAVKQYNASQRQGTHKSKEKGEVRASTRKIKRQKGTGTARAGSLKSPLFRGGGRVFGPKPRVYGIRLNKKVKSLARRSALASKFNNEQVLIVEDFAFDAPSTKSYIDVLKNLNVAHKKSLVVTSEDDKILYLSSRNIKTSNVSTAKDLNVYQILNSGAVILSESAVESIKESF